jgi:hypothetical protein
MHLDRFSSTARMSSVDFTRGLTRPRTLTGRCHCDPGTTVCLVPELALNEKSGRTVVVAYHCWLCRCDECTPAAHARHAIFNERSNGLSGCGPRCTRSGVLPDRDPMPSFKARQRTNGGAALRRKERES